MLDISLRLTYQLSIKDTVLLFGATSRSQHCFCKASEPPMFASSEPLFKMNKCTLVFYNNFILYGIIMQIKKTKSG